MEEKKQRNMFFSKGLKSIEIILFMIAVSGFAVCAALVMGLIHNGFTWNDIKNADSRSYMETFDCGYEMAMTVYDLVNIQDYGSPFLTDGKLDEEKLVDISNLSAKKSKQNPATTYKVKDLQKLLESDEWNDFKEFVWESENIYYEEDTYDEEEEIYYDETTTVVEEQREWSESDVIDISDYTERFKYLYKYARPLEIVLPVSGETLAEYARENPRKESLYTLYTELISVTDTLYSYMENIEEFGDATNILYMIQNLDTQEVLTNVKEWENGKPDPHDVEKDAPYFYAERNKGKLTNVAGNDTDAGRAIYNHIADLNILGENEKIVISLDTKFPLNDDVASAYDFYDVYAKWGIMMCYGILICFSVAVVLLILLTIQSGYVCTDRAAHVTGIERIPTEVIGIAAIGVLVGMGGIMAFGITESGHGSGFDPFIFAFVAVGEAVCSGVFLAAYLSIVRRCKAKIFWKSSICSAIVKNCRKVYAARMTSGRVIAAFLIIVFGNCFMSVVFGGFGFFLALLADGIVLLYLIRENAGRQVLYDGLERIASGELEYKIETKELTGDNRRMAEAVNRVGDGLQNAVKETLKSERLKADLITNVSHDIKTPLTSIINYVDLLKREEIEDPKICGYIDVLDKKSKRLKQLTEDLVEASKVSSGNVVLDMKAIRFGELIRQTNGEFEEKFATKGLELICKIDEEPLVILADGRRMWRVVENLYNNVAKYAMPNTRVYVEARKLGRRIVLDVKNISEYPLNIKAEELTERFIRGDVSRSTEGSGLGLSIAQNLVKMQNGTFDIYLDGDLFKVTITFAVAEAPEETKEK